MGRPSNAEKAAKLAAEQGALKSGTAPQPTTELTEVSEQTGEHISTNITEADFFALQDKCDKLEAAISRIAVLTGNGNHLRELGIERWVPGKKDMNKKYA